MKKVLVTGGAGYIGSVLVRQLLEKGHHVRAFDSLKFGGEALYEVLMHPHFEFMMGDLRNAEDVKKAVAGMDAVCHLAAIVGDPACSKFADEAREVNGAASEDLYRQSLAAGVKQFVFASTCSNYGKMAEGGSFVTEESELRPVSLYAELKVAFEQFLMANATPEMTTTVLRFSTVYGFSPRVRFDLTVNEFTRDVALGKELVIFGEQFWRPYCHVDDLAGAVVLVLESPADKVAGQVFNAGSTDENYNKRMLAEEIAKVAPEMQVSYVQRTEDPRDYRVNFDKITNELGFKITKTVPDGIREIYSLIKTGLIDDPYGPKFRNI
jgi:nucleoside-diphosphate-sugar epimerase